MPRCEEPWYEFKFENPKEGTAQVSPAGCVSHPLAMLSSLTGPSHCQSCGLRS